MNGLIQNWQTTSAGLLMILGAIVHLVFATVKGVADESTWMGSLTTILGGVGLIAAGDAKKSKADADKIAADLQATKTAVVSGDTSHLTNPDQPPRPPASETKP